jgi:glycosyltransferase involved in cell wall biosynthesis
MLTFARRLACNAASVNIAITEHVNRRLHLQRTTVIYHGIPESIDLTSRQIDTTNNTPRVVTFAYVGRLVSEKGLHLLVQAAKRLRSANIEFLMKFIGDGPERSSLESAAEAAGLTDLVKFTGHRKGAELEQTVQDVDVVVMPSIWEETAGLSAIEQMMRERLVIAADIGGLGEVVDDTGLKFPAGNAQQLADRMRLVIGQPDLIETLGRRARARATKIFGQQRMVDQHIALFQKSTLTPPTGYPRVSCERTGS